MDIMEHRSLWIKIKDFIKYRILRIKESKYDGWCLDMKPVILEDNYEVLIHISHG